MLSRELHDQHLEIRGDRVRWESVTAHGAEATIIFNSWVRGEPGDSFSKLILSTRAYFARIPTEAEHSKRRLLERILATDWMLGVVAKPGFSEEAHHHECIFAVARHLGGMIFNGRDMLDDHGNAILTAEGASEVESHG